MRPVCWDVLMYLVDHRDEVVPIDTLLDAIWNDRRGEPAYVRKAVHELRSALNDSEGRIIRTLPKVGYVIPSELVDLRGSTDPATRSADNDLVYGRLSSRDYEGISRRLRRDPEDSES